MARSVEDFIVDFSKEEEAGGGGARYKEDTYLFVITGAKTGTSEDKGTPYLEIGLKFKEGKYKGKKLTERLYVTPKALSRFRTLMEAVGISVPGKLNLVKLIPKLKGKELWCELQDDTSREPVRSRVSFQGFYNVDDYEPDEADEDEVEEDEEEDELDDDLEEEEEPEPPKRRGRGASARKRAKKQPEPEEDEDEEEDEEEEPPKRKRASKSKAKKEEPEEDEDEDDDLDDLDLDSM